MPPPPSGQLPPPPPEGAFSTGGGSGDDSPGEDKPPQGGQPPNGCGQNDGFKNGFLNRVWRVEIEVDSVDGLTLSGTLNKFLNLPRKFRDQDDRMVDQVVHLKLRDATKITDENGDDASVKDLSKADKILAKAKLLKEDQWDEEDGTPVTTLVARRIRILS